MMKAISEISNGSGCITMEKSPVLFSIVVPIYGVEAFLPQAIESVLSQSVSEWELILVDDGSPDRCGEICDQYASLDKRIRVIHKQNGGLVSARQAGVAQCKGKYVLNLDGDDYWDHDLLSELEAVICQYHPDAISFGLRRITEEGVWIKEQHLKVAGGLYAGDSLETIWDGMLYDPKEPEINTGNFVYGVCATAFRREIIAPLQLIVPHKISMGEDIAVTIPAVCRCKSVFFLDIIKYNYRVRNSSISNTFSPFEMEETERIRAHLKKYADHLPAQNLGCFLYRKMEGYWIKAARNLSTYKEFRACVSESFKTISQDAVGHISKCKLKLKYRLRLFIVKHDLWYLFWLFYHRGSRKA